MTTTQTAAIAAILDEKVWIAKARLGSGYSIGTVRDHYGFATMSDKGHAWAVSIAEERGEVELVDALVAIRALVKDAE
jgi:hypothetical protein